MNEKSFFAHVLGSARSDPSGSRGGFNLSAKLRARMKNIEKWRIHPSSIKSPKVAREFHGGHATVSKAFLLDTNPTRLSWEKPYDSREVLQLCRSSSESNDHIRRAAGHRWDAEEELDEEEKDDKKEHGSDSDELWYGQVSSGAKLFQLALRETEFLVELSHPNIVELKGFVEDISKDIIWLVFPWADNGNLKDFVASREWEIPERISLINDVANGLEHLHNQEPPVCHGDLKSYNVLVSSERRAVITDFGSARRLTEDDLSRQQGLVQNQQQPLQAVFSTLSKTITLTGNIYTLRWAAPELLNEEQMSLWSDIWALGWIAYETLAPKKVLTNSIPFQDVSADAAVVERVIKGHLPSMNEHDRVSLFEKLCTLMTMCWNSNPSERPTAKDYLRTVSDMPMVIPNPTYSRFYIRSPSETLMMRGREARTSGDLRMAFACFTEAHRIYTRTGDRHGRASALFSLAEVHRVRNKYSEAIAHYSGVLQICTDIGNRRGRASALFSLAEVYRLQTEYSEAITLYSKVLQVRTDIGDRQGRADTLWTLASVRRARNEYSEAIALYSEDLQIRTDIGDRRGRADALWGLAEVHRLRDEYSEAMAFYSQYLQICTDIDNKQGSADAPEGLADIHRHQDHHDETAELRSGSDSLRLDPS
ncbi:hypothetical protein FRC05_008257 [Tulasnella sp. 425]|nr:hypothetical protein FRC05_008257 [Tulasnella sp. 425]